MNKIGFLSGVITILLLFLPFLPIGIYFWNETTSSLELNSYIKFPVSLLNLNNTKIFLWGSTNGNSITFWFTDWFNNFSVTTVITFLFLIVLSILAIIFSFLGCVKENQKGRRYMSFNFFAIFFIIFFTIIGFTIYSEEIFGSQFGLLEIYQYLDTGFYILLINFILSIIAFIKHPIK